MSTTSGHVTTSEENDKLGSDVFGSYVCELEELLSHNEEQLPFPHQASPLDGDVREVGGEKSVMENGGRTEENSSFLDSSSLFSDGVGAQFSKLMKEKLKSLLRQSVFTLTREVDEMVNPVLSLCRIRSCLRCKGGISSSGDFERKADQLEHRDKKLKETNLSDDVVKKCVECHATETPQWRPGSDGEKIDDDVQFILENDSNIVEELMQKHSGELYDLLHYMDQKLQDLLNITMTTCRPMNGAEKQELHKMIQTLPPKNLDRVVEIIGRNRHSLDEVNVDLKEVDNAVLWRVYFYVHTFNASAGMEIEKGNCAADRTSQEGQV